VKLLPIADRHLDYIYEVKRKLEAAGIQRVEVDDRSEKNRLQNPAKHSWKKEGTFLRSHIHHGSVYTGCYDSLPSRSQITISTLGEKTPNLLPMQLK